MTYLPDTPPPVRRLIALVTAFAGLLTMIAILTPTGDIDETGSAMLAGALLGAGCSGLFLAGLLGHRREDDGIWIGIVGAILTTGLGSFLGGIFWAFSMLASTVLFGDAPFLSAFGADLLQAGLFAFMFIMTYVPVEFPHVLGIWIILMAGVHHIAMRARQRTAACASQKATDRS